MPVVTAFYMQQQHDSIDAWLRMEACNNCNVSYDSDHVVEHQLSDSLVETLYVASVMRQHQSMKCDALTAALHWVDGAASRVQAPGAIRVVLDCISIDDMLLFSISIMCEAACRKACADCTHRQGALTQPGHPNIHMASSPHSHKYKTLAKISCCRQQAHMTRSCCSFVVYGGDALISHCIWSAGYGMTQPVQSYFKPHVQMFDLGRWERRPFMNMLIDATEGNCNELCQAQVTSSSHSLCS